MISQRTRDGLASAKARGLNSAATVSRARSPGPRPNSALKGSVASSRSYLA